MKVFVTVDHDVMLCNSEIVELLEDSNPTEEELSELDTLDTNDEHYDCYGDDYANEVINSIGFFRAHYGEV